MPKQAGWSAGEVKKQNFHSYYVTEDDYYFLEQLYDWLILKKDDVYE